MYKNQSISRAFSILEILCDHPGGLAVSEVSEHCDLHRATAHRLLEVLRNLGYVTKAERSGRYTIGFRMGRFGSKSLIIRRVLIHARQPLLALAHRTSALVIIGSIRGLHMVTAEKFLGDMAVKPRPMPADTIGAHASAVGKALLSMQNQHYLWRSFSNVKLDALTPQTITEPKALFQSLSDARSQGYAVETNEVSEGFTSIGVPLLNPAGRATVAVSVTLPSHLMSKPADHRKMARTIENTCADIVAKVVDQATSATPEALPSE